MIKWRLFRFRIRRLFAVWTIILSCNSPAAAVDFVDRASANTSWIFGDWGGVRTRLKMVGVDLQIGYVGEIASNATGGLYRQTAYADQWVAGVRIDLGHLGLLQGGTIQTTFTDRNGRSLSEDANLGTLQAVQEIYGRGRTTRLTRFWYNQEFADGLLEWKVGRIPFSEDFSSFACDFQNLTFCGTAAGNIVSDTIYNWPISQWATRLKLNLSGVGYFQFGAFDQNPKYLNLSHALLPVFSSGSTGVLIPGEFGWLPKIAGLQGSYKFGGWIDTSTANDVAVDILGGFAAITQLPYLQRRGRWGAYVNFLQQIGVEGDGISRRGLSMFFNATIADSRTAVIDAQFAAGLIYTGPFQGRPNDNIGLAIGTTHVNSRLAVVQVLQNQLGLSTDPVRHNEYVVEAYYTVRPYSGLEIRPNIQFVGTPGGTAQNRSALVFGLKTIAGF